MIHIIFPLFGFIAGCGFILLVHSLEGNRSVTIIQQAIESRRINQRLQKALGRRNHREDNLLENTRYYLSKKQYNRIRLIGCAIIFCIAGLIHEQRMGMMAIGLYFVSTPKEYLMKVPLPWHFFYGRLLTIEREKMDNELIEGMSFLKNLIVAQNGRSMGGDYIITYLAENADLTKDAYTMLLNKMRLHQVDEGEELFIERIGTDLAKDMAHLLTQLDSLDPIGLREAVENRQRAYREIKITKQQRADSLTSDIIYFPIVLTIFIIMMNFFLIAYYLPQEEMLRSVF